MKKKKTGCALEAVFLVLAGGLNLLLQLMKDDCIIYFGVAVYRIFQTVGLVLLAGAAVWLGTALVRGRKRKQPQERSRKQEEASPVLSVKEKLSNASLRNVLTELAAGKWKGLSEELSVTISQMEQMDTYQERLHELLRQNDIKALSDTEDVLDQAEQYMCQNVRKLINYMNVFDEGDREVVAASVTKTNEKNKEQLKQVRDFIVAVTDFVNQQGSKQDPNLLNVYKQMILDSVKEEL